VIDMWNIDRSAARKCPYCGSLQTNVVDSRTDEGGRIMRRRSCLKCGRRWTTEEKIISLTHKSGD